MSKLVAFKYAGKWKKIKVNPSAGYDQLLLHVAKSFGLDSIELNYEDPADGEVYILSSDEELEETFEQNYKWKVVPSQTSKPAWNPGAHTAELGTSFANTTITDQAESLLTQRDEYDPSLLDKKEKWADMIRADWLCASNAQQHPFFISYSHASERDLAKELYHQMKVALLQESQRNDLSDMPAHAFLDSLCLSFGGKLDINFLSGLLHSSVIILLCSDKSMKGMLRADEVPDNFLLQWELALQMCEERGHTILPILLSSRVLATLSDGKQCLLTRKFSSFDFSRFPDKLHIHPLSQKRLSVRQTIDKIFEFNGPNVNPETDMMKIIVEAREVLNRRKAELQISSSDTALSRTDLSELEIWLSPLWVEMDAERDALLRNFHHGTRQWLLKKVFQCFDLKSSIGTKSSRVVWLKGVAGVGKSVMAALISRELQAVTILGGQFFFKHDDEKRSSAHKLVTTLAFGLARYSVHYGRYLLQFKRENPDILSMSAFEVMRRLIAQPLVQLADAEKLKNVVVFVIDALDECGLVNSRQEILLAFQELNRLLPANVKILVTGRPELDIVEAFQTIPTESLEPTAEENVSDLLLFAESGLSSLSDDSSIIEEGSRVLVEKSAGVFVWLIAALKFLSSSRIDKITLDEIFALPEGDKLDGTMDVMYDRIFSGILEACVQQNLQDLLCKVLVVIFLGYEPMSAAGIALMLSKEEPGTVKRCVRMLEPVLVIESSGKKIRVYHKSVKDYLFSPTRCSIAAVQIDSRLGHSNLAQLCISALDENLRFNICDLPFAGFHNEIPDFADKLDKGIPEHLKYAIKHFWEHFVDSSLEPKFHIESSLSRQLNGFLRLHGHHYLEACSLIDALNVVIPAMTSMQKVALADEEEQVEWRNLSVLMEDIKRVTQKFLIPLKSSALQVYFTAIPFSPYESEFYKMFCGKGPSHISCPRLLKGQRATWPSSVSVFEGHSKGVNSAAFSPDGQFVASGSDDKSIKIWNASTGQELQQLEGHSDYIASVGFSPDGQLIVSGSFDNTVRIWNVYTGQELRKLEGHSDWVCSVAFSPDGQLIATGSADHTVCIWPAFEGEALHRLEGHSYAVNFTAFSPDGQFVTSASFDATVRIWNASTGQQLLELVGHSYPVTSAEFSPDGEFVLSASQDKTIRIWSASTGLELLKLMGHTDEVNYAAFSPDGKLIVSGSNDKTVRIWNATTGHELHKLSGHTDTISATLFSPSGQLVVSGSADKTIRIWNPFVGKEPTQPDKHEGLVNFAAFSPDGQLVVSGGSDNTVRIWKAATGQQVLKLEGHSGIVDPVAFSPDGQFVLSGSSDMTVRLWSVSTGQELKKLEGYFGGVLCAVFSSDGQFVVSGDSDYVVRIHKSSIGEELHKLKGHSHWVLSVAFSPDGQFIVSASADKTVRIWSSHSGQEVYKLKGHTGKVLSAAFSPDGKFVASGSDDKTVRIWNAYTGQELYKLEGHMYSVQSVIFSSNGQFIASMDTFGRSRLWNTVTMLEVDDALSTPVLESIKVTHHFHIRNVSGVKLQSGKIFHSPVVKTGVWFCDNVSGVSCWIPPDHRGDWQLMSKNVVLTLGGGCTSLIQF